jgi:tRNA pseudouridine38-40 synthase
LTLCIFEPSKIQDSLRYFIEIAYNGKNYFGWQMQPDAISVQEVIEQTFSIILREEIKVVGAGRTDSGVHARQLFAHFDCNDSLEISELIFKVNSLLPKDIAVNNIFLVTNDAHARFDAIEREYEYVISLRKDPFNEDFSYLIHHKPDVIIMNKASKALLDYNDFQCFSRSKTDVKTYHCVIKRAFWKEENNQLIFTITADRFLRNMVRAIVGTLLEVGFEKKSLSDFHKIIQDKNRSNAGASAPAHGLYLTKVKYPDEIFKKV